LLIAADALAADPTSLSAARREALTTFRDELLQIARELAPGNAEREAAARRWPLPDARHRLLLALPAEGGRAPTNNSFAEAVTAARKKQSARLFDLVRQFAEADSAGAYQLLFEVLREDPDHEEARRILGYRREKNGSWDDGQPAIATRAAAVDEPNLGWRRGYDRVDSAHFQVVSNHARKEGAFVAQRLETLHDVCRCSRIVNTRWFCFAIGPAIRRRSAPSSPSWQ
jgi:hypothetical protein